MNGDPYTPAENAIIVREYPLSGRNGVRAALLNAGYQDRSKKAISGRVQRARKDGIHIPYYNRDPTTKRADLAVIERIIAVFTDYRGIPLTVQDLHYELSVSRSVLHGTLADLISENRVTSWDGPDGAVYKLAEPTTVAPGTPPAVRAHSKPTRSPRKPHNAAQATP